MINKGKFLYIGAIAFLFLSSVLPLSAQVGITLQMNRKTYLQYENVYARINLRNYSAHPLAFGKNKGLSGKLLFEIYDAKGALVPRISNELPDIEGTLLKPGSTQEVVTLVSRYYDLSQPGNYKITAYISHPQLTSDYQSDPVTFNVSQGVDVWKRIVGTPDFVNKVEKIRPRTFRIISLFDGTDKVFYLMIEDDKKVYSVKRIGYEMGGTKPECEIDSLSRLHILLKLSSTIFVYFLYDIDGSLEKRDVYKKEGTTPTLVRNPQSGAIVVAGGEKAKKEDYQDDPDLPFKNTDN
jgi:hypothetical protein